MSKCLKTGMFYVLTMLLLLLFMSFYNRGVTTFTENIKPAYRFNIVIDPGHGGEDGGAVSCTGVPESVYNLAISRRLQDLMNLLGYKTVMIRDSDISVYTKGETLAQKKASDLTQRVKIVNDTAGAVLLSIHQNYFDDSQYSGAQVFYAKTEGSQQLASELQKEIVSKLNKGSRRQAKMISGIYLMEHINCPGVLVECGFLSNQQEEALLRNSEYQKKISAVIAASLSQWLSNT